jgi:hypothetical protein
VEQLSAGCRPEDVEACLYTAFELVGTHARRLRAGTRRMNMGPFVGGLRRCARRVISEPVRRGDRRVRLAIAPDGRVPHGPGPTARFSLIVHS